MYLVIHQKKRWKHLDNLLQTMLERRNNDQQPSAKELEQPQRKKSENGLEK